MPADCKYSLQGVNSLQGTYTFPVSWAPAPYYTSAGVCSSNTHLAKAAWSSDNSPSTYMDFQTDIPRMSNTSLSWDGVLKTWVGGGQPLRGSMDEGLGLPSATGRLSGSNLKYYTPGDYKVSQSGPSAFTLTSGDLGCEYTYRITAGSFLGLAPTPCKPGTDADCPKACAAGSFKQQQQQPTSAGYICALCGAGSASADGSSCKPCINNAVKVSWLYGDYSFSGDLAYWRVGANSCSASPAAATAATTQTKDSGSARKMLADKPNSTGSMGSKSSIGSMAASSSSTGYTAAASSSPCDGLYKPQAGNASKPLYGSGVLAVDSSDLSSPVCKSNKAFADFAAWLSGKQTWFSYQAPFSAGDAPIIQWQVLGSTAGSKLARLPTNLCSAVSLGGTRSDPAYLTHKASLLGGFCSARLVGK